MAPDSLEHRSWTMSRIRSKDTAPEMLVRRLVHSLGYRYRLHAKALPGKPDIVFASKRKVIFVHGCFWHRHTDPDCKLTRTPKSNVGYWIPKFDRNRERDGRNVELLEELGWSVLVIWQCQLKDIDLLRKKITCFLEKDIPMASS